MLSSDDIITIVLSSGPLSLCSFRKQKSYYLLIHIVLFMYSYNRNNESSFWYFRFVLSKVPIQSSKCAIRLKLCGEISNADIYSDITDGHLSWARVL